MCTSPSAEQAADKTKLLVAMSDFSPTQSRAVPCFEAQILLDSGSHAVTLGGFTCMSAETKHLMAG